MQQRQAQVLKHHIIPRLVFLLPLCVACTSHQEQPSSRVCESMLKKPDAAIIENDAVRAATKKSELADWKVNRVALDDSGRGLIGVSWEAPPASILFLTDCKRAAFAFAESPRVDSLSVVHMTEPGSPLVLVAYSEGGATSFEARGLSLYSLSDTLTELWNGTTFQGNYDNELGVVDSAVVSIDSASITRRSWSWKVQSHAGKWVPVGKPRVLTDRYVWVAGAKRFERTAP